MSTKEDVLNLFRAGWPVSTIDGILGLEQGRARRIVVTDWKEDSERAVEAKLKRVYKFGGGSWLKPTL